MISLLDCPVWSQELDLFLMGLMLLMGPFQLRIFRDSKMKDHSNLQWSSGS